MIGAMLNDFQNGPDGTPIYYDEPSFDVFWETGQELDVVVYIHPRFPHPSVIQNLFGGRHGLLGACWYQRLPYVTKALQEFCGGGGHTPSWSLYERRVR